MKKAKWNSHLMGRIYTCIVCFFVHSTALISIIQQCLYVALLKWMEQNNPRPHPPLLVHPCKLPFLTSLETSWQTLSGAKSRELVVKLDHCCQACQERLARLHWSSLLDSKEMVKMILIELWTHGDSVNKDKQNAIGKLIMYLLCNGKM